MSSTANVSLCTYLGGLGLGLLDLELSGLLGRHLDRYLNGKSIVTPFVSSSSSLGQAISRSVFDPSSPPATRLNKPGAQGREGPDGKAGKQQEKKTRNTERERTEAVEGRVAKGTRKRRLTREESKDVLLQRWRGGLWGAKKGRNRCAFAEGGGFVW